MTTTSLSGIRKITACASTSSNRGLSLIHISFESVDVSDFGDEMIIVTVVYRSSEDESLILTIWRFESIEDVSIRDAEYEADENLQSEFVIDGIRFFVMSNIDRSSIAWNDGTQSIFITGDLSSDEATQMILTRQ